MNKGNRFASLKSNPSNPFKQDKRQSHIKPMNTSSRFKHLSSESENKNTFKKTSYHRGGTYNRDNRDNRDNRYNRDNRRSNRGNRGRYNNRYNRRYYKSNKPIEESVFQPSCLKNTGIESLMVVKTSQKDKKTQKTKVKPIKTNYKYDTDQLSSEEKELNNKLILQYQSTLEQQEEEELTQINDCWDDNRESENTIIIEPEDDDNYQEESEEEMDEYSAENYTQQFI